MDSSHLTEIQSHTDMVVQSVIRSFLVVIYLMLYHEDTHGKLLLLQLRLLLLKESYLVVVKELHLKSSTS